MIPDPPAHHHHDAALLDLVDGSGFGRSTMVVGPQVLRGSDTSAADNRLFGGASLALACAAMERWSGRDLLWCTAQLVGIAPLGAQLEVETEVLAAGRRATQLQVSARVDDQLILRALGTAGALDPDGPFGVGITMPEVTGPQEATTLWGSGEGQTGWSGGVTIGRAQLRAPVAGVADPDTWGGFWMEFVEPRPATPAALAVLGDTVPMVVARACGIVGAGTSLDNSIRLAARGSTGPVLVDMRPTVGSGGFGHGVAHLWSADGRLLGTAHQTSSILALPFDPLTTEDPPLPLG